MHYELVFCDNRHIIVHCCGETNLRWSINKMADDIIEKAACDLISQAYMEVFEQNVKIINKERELGLLNSNLSKGKSQTNFTQY